MRVGKSISAGFALLVFASMSLNAAPMHPVEQRLRERFPSVQLESCAAFDAAEEIVGPSVITGLRAHFTKAPAPRLRGIPEALAMARSTSQPDETALRVTYPRFYGDPLVAVLGEQRVVLRAVNARGVAADAMNGKLIYQEAYPAVDAVETPDSGRSEELLLLRDDSAQLVYDFEIVEMRGVAAVVMNGRAIRFLPNAIGVPGSSQIAGARFAQIPRMLQIEQPWVVDAMGRRSEAHATWSLIGDGSSPRKIRLTVNGNGLAYPLVVDPSFSATGSLITARLSHSETLLQNGKVLIAGGYGNTGELTSAELYDPASGTFTATGSMATPRDGHSATLLPNGKVLIAGGYNFGSNFLTSAELYDPATGTFSATGSLSVARDGHTATLLANGKVLIAGGYTGNYVYPTLCELYNPATGMFSSTGSLSVGRQLNTATLLPNGKVLIAGGTNSTTYVAAAELYDPSGGTFSATGSMAKGRSAHTATLLPNGKVLIAGGWSGSPLYLSSAELYDPASGIGTFSATGSLTTARGYHAATLLPNGKVLITGGASNTVIASAELFDPASGGGTFSDAGSLITGRYNQRATLLPNGNVMVAGGATAGLTPLSSVELFDPASGSFGGGSGYLVTPRAYHTATPLPDGKVLLAGGYNIISSSYLSAAELYDPSTDELAATGDLTMGRRYHTATLLSNGKVLIVGGTGADSPQLSSAELYDPSTGTFSTTGSLITPRYSHTATLLPNGKVMIAGGLYNGFSLVAAELYDPNTGTFSPTGNLVTARGLHTATLMTNGRVILAGGVGVPAELSSAELYDPTSGTFSTTGNLTVGRFGHTATLLPSGKVLIACGRGAASAFLSSAEIYDPAASVFVATGSLATARDRHTATLLPNGNVLVDSGFGNGGSKASPELYDPTSGTFSDAGPYASLRTAATATLLLNGKVLIAGGYYNTTAMTLTFETYDSGLGYADSRRPVVTIAPGSLLQPAALTLSGSGFRGDSEGSSGSYTGSATNYPLLRLQRVDNDQMMFLSPGLAWSDSSFTSNTLSGLPSGPYRASIVTNAIPSLERIILITGPPTPTIISVSPLAGPTNGGQPVAISGTNLTNAISVTFGGLAGTITANTATSITVTSPAHSAGAVDVTVTTGGGSAKLPGGYTYSAFGAPAFLSATATSTSQVALTWTGVGDATSYDIYRSSLGGAFNFVSSTAGTSATDNGLFANTTYLYAVRAVAGGGVYSPFTPIDPATTIVFSDSSLTGVLIQAVHLTQLRTAVNAMRAAANLSPATFTDPTLTPGVTMIKQAHVAELRAALNEARSTIGLPAIVYTDPTITSGSTVMKAVHLTELRAGTQ